jgi:hypothetical protein
LRKALAAAAEQTLNGEDGFFKFGFPDVFPEEFFYFLQALLCYDVLVGEDFSERSEEGQNSTEKYEISKKRPTIQLT